jgi:pyruvate dehydrogenase E2 component (dihydrolipoamide acetyltransferase)
MDVKLPKLSEGAESGSVVSLLVAEGESVEKGQALLEVENEKAVAPIPATESGVVSSIRVKEGDTVSVGQVLLVISGGSEAEAEPPAAAPASTLAPVATSSAVPIPVAPVQVPVDSEIDESGPTPAASPSIRIMARQLGINLRRVGGSGRGGRVELGDLQNYIQRLQQLAAVKPQSGGAARAVAASIDFSKWGPVRSERMSPLRQTISRRMSESWSNVVHVTQFDEADVTDLMVLRKKHQAAYAGKDAKLTLTTFALKAVVTALKAHPVFNSSLDEAKNELVFKDYYHIGLAVDTEHGLMVPVIRDVDRKSLLELSLEVTALAEKARARKIGLEEMQGGTFTISNQGGIGGGHFTPIVNRPEVAILGMGRGGQKPLVKDGNVEVRSCLPLTISYDHRVIDGGTAARFSVDFVKALEGFEDKDVSI